MKNELEQKIGKEEFKQALADLARAKDLHDLVNRQNNLESFVHGRVPIMGRHELEVTKKLIEGDEEEEMMQIREDAENNLEPFNNSLPKGNYVPYGGVNAQMLATNEDDNF
jgi:hypothetical protein